MTTHATLLTTLALIALALPARADEAIATSAAANSPRFVPTLSLETGQYAEELRLDLGERTEREQRALWSSRLALGLGYPIPIDGLGFGQLRGQSSVGVGLVYELGHWPVHLRQELLLALPLTAGLAAVGGLGTGVQLNTSAWARSYWEFTTPIGLRAGPVEVLYLPAALIGLGAETEEVFGGERRHGVANGLAPLNIVARVRFERLGW